MIIMIMMMMTTTGYILYVAISSMIARPLI